MQIYKNLIATLIMFMITTDQLETSTTTSIGSSTSIHPIAATTTSTISPLANSTPLPTPAATPAAPAATPAAPAATPAAPAATPAAPAATPAPATTPTAEETTPVMPTQASSSHAILTSVYIQNLSNKAGILHSITILTGKNSQSVIKNNINVPIAPLKITSFDVTIDQKNSTTFNGISTIMIDTTTLNLNPSIPTVNSPIKINFSHDTWTTPTT